MIHTLKVAFTFSEYFLLFYFIFVTLLFKSVLISIVIKRSTKVNILLSYDVASGSEITPCNKIDKPLVVYRFTGNVMTSITTLRT